MLTEWQLMSPFSHCLLISKNSLHMKTCVLQKTFREELHPPQPFFHVAPPGAPGERGFPVPGRLGSVRVLQTLSPRVAL